jgi:hypothetical protein
MGLLESITGGISGLEMPKCPIPFESVGNLSCVMSCPTERGYERRSVNGGFQCVYKSDPSFSTTLNTVSAVVFPGTTLQQLQTVNPTAYSEFLREQDRFTNEIVVMDGKLNKDIKLRDAFQKLQDAENVRDQVPDAYQQARSAYYILKEGERWKEIEKERLMKSEVEPIVQKIVNRKNDALRQYETQRKTVDVVNGLKDKVLSLKDEVKYAADTFKDQIHKVENAIQRERKSRSEKPEPSIWDWLDSILNILIVASLLYALYSIYQKYVQRSRLSSYGTIY